MGLMFDTPTFELHADHGPLLIRITIVMMVLSFISIILRFLSRRLVKQPFLSDDWMIVAGVVFAWVTCLLEIIGTRTSDFGRHYEFATATSITYFFKTLYVIQITYLVAIACIKFSIMLLYRRVFSIPQTKWPLIILATFEGAWLIATILVGVFSCSPIDGFWIKTKPSACINDIRYFLAVAIPNIFTDVALIIFPIPLIWNLKITQSQKIALSVIFLLGSFVIVASCLRLVALLQASNNPDFSWALIPLGIWNSIEVNVGVICACLPIMRPLLRVLLRQNIKNLISKSDKSKPPTSRSYWPSRRTSSFPDNAASFICLDDVPSNDGAKHGPKTTICGPGSEDIQLQELERSYAKTGIRVEHNITWT